MAGKIIAGGVMTGVALYGAVRGTVILKAMLTGEYERMEILGEGAFGTVYKVRHRATGKYFAVKEMESAKSGSHELTVLTKLPKHDNIVQVFDLSYEKGKYTYLYMELCPEGDLNKFLLKMDRERLMHDFQSNQRDVQFMRQMASAIQFLHQNGLVHRDLKLENILVHETEPGRHCVKITDFGVSKVVELRGPMVTADLVRSGQLEKAYMKTGVGTEVFKAPELAQKGTDYNNKVDIFSLGVIYCAMLERKVHLIEGKEYICAFCPGDVPIGLALSWSPTAVRELDGDIWINNVHVANKLLRPLVNNMMKKDHHDRPSTSNVHDTLHSLCSQPEMTTE